MGGVPARHLEDHHEALAFWRELGVQGATCLRFGRHPALSDGDAESGTLHEAMRTGVVSRLIWVLPVDGYPENPLEWLRMQLPEWLDPTLEDYASLHEHEGRVHGRLLGGELVLCRGDYLPVLPEAVLVDLDVGYMLDDAERVWISASEFARQFRWLPVRGLTACSADAPPRFRYVADMALHLLGGSTEAETLARVDEELSERAARPGTPPEDYDALVELFPDLPAWLQAAVAHEAAIAAGEPEEGPRRRRAQQLEPGYRLSARRRARHLLRRGRLERALEAFREVPLPDSRDRLLQADVLVRLERPAEALRHLDSDADPEAFRLRALALDLQGARDEALGAWRRAAELDPARADRWRDLGLALARSGRRPEAEEALRRSLQQAPDRLGSLEAHMELAHLYRLDGRDDLAEAELQQVREKDRLGLYLLPPVTPARRRGPASSAAS